MNSISQKVYVGICVLIGLVSAFSSYITSLYVGNTVLAYLGMGMAVFLSIASLWGVYSIYKNKMAKFVAASTLAFAGSFVFQLSTSADAIFSGLNPEISIFVITAIMLCAGICMCMKMWSETK